MKSMLANMSRRERVLAGIVGAVVFLLLNAGLFSFFIKRQAALRAAASSAEMRLDGMRSILAEREIWIRRDAWLSQNHPRLANETTASVQLLDQVRNTARQHELTAENPRIESLQATKFYRSVPVSVELVGSWSSLVGFLYDLQQPTAFIVLENANIKIDDADKSKMRASLKIAKWYAPNSNP